VKKNIREPINDPVLVMVGPTAIGKTALSIEIAKRFHCEIVSVDSMQVYKYMDIGTAKVTSKEQNGIKHHLLDIVSPDEHYDAAKFSNDALLAVDSIHNRGMIPLLTGGTGLYLQALFEGIFPKMASNPKIRNELQGRLQVEGHSKLYEELCLIDCYSAKRIHPNDKHRLLRALEIYMSTGVTWTEHIRKHRESLDGVCFKNVLKIGLTCDREKLYKRINIRCDNMLKSGFEEEVKNLFLMGYGKYLKPFRAIGYKHMIKYLEGEVSHSDMKLKFSRDTRRYAKRQYTWFSKIKDLHWFNVNDKEGILQIIEKWLIKQH